MQLEIHYSELDDKYWISTGDEVHWFDGPRQAQDGLRQLQIDQAVRDEVKLIADWFWGMGMRQTASAIEDGDYKK